MGLLVGKALPTLGGVAEHTYVECGNGARSWGCWGRKKGGRELSKGPGSTKRANKIAQRDEKANVECYLINGVCHQSANRILIPAGVTVRGAKGYGLSQAIYGPYGRKFIWPCKGEFKRFKGVSGDIKECLFAKEKRRRKSRWISSDFNRSNFQYIKMALALYDRLNMSPKNVDRSMFHKLEIELFMLMANFQLGPMLDKKLKAKLVHGHTVFYDQREVLEKSLAMQEIPGREFVDNVNSLTLLFQENMAEMLGNHKYQALFDANRDDRLVLADEEIIKQTERFK